MVKWAAVWLHEWPSSSCEEWRKRDGEDDDPWENHGPDGYQPPSYEPVNPERRTAQTPSDGLI